jgi:hypothetical protein
MRAPTDCDSLLTQYRGKTNTTVVEMEQRPEAIPLDLEKPGCENGARERVSGNGRNLGGRCTETSIAKGKHRVKSANRKYSSCAARRGVGFVLVERRIASPP